MNPNQPPVVTQSTAVPTGVGPNGANPYLDSHGMQCVMLAAVFAIFHLGYTAIHKWGLTRAAAGTGGGKLVG